MDRNVFFREATLRLCGSLDIAEALFSIRRFLSEVMPADIMYLEYVDAAYGSMRTIAMASAEGGEEMDMLTPLSHEAQAEAEHTLLRGPKAYLLEDPHSEKIADELLRFHKISASSLIVLILESGSQMLGSLAIISQGEKRLRQDHAESLALLREPFSIALSNALKHREVIKLKDLLADDNRYLHVQRPEAQGSNQAQGLACRRQPILTRRAAPHVRRRGRRCQLWAKAGDDNGPPGVGSRQPGSVAWGNRHGQGCDGPIHPLRFTAKQEAVHIRQLWGHSRNSDRQ